jgi:hypothetical protein
MIVKVSIFVVLAFFCVPVVSSAQSSGSSASSIESLNLQDIADESIVMLSKEESGTPGYISAKYAFIHGACPGRVQLVHYSGPGFDVNDRTVLKNEQKKCSQQSYDEGSDE